jgi:hypothetical protein
MTRYNTQEREKYQNEVKKYWPVASELMAQYTDGTHTDKSRYGNLYWKKNNQLHRDSDKPAAVYTDGSLAWYQNGLLHRDNDKPAVIHGDGSLGWCQNHQQHRDGDLPAIISASGTLEWWQNNHLHRLCSPAAIYANGTLEWWINDENITREVRAWLAGEEWQDTPLQIAEFQLRFS